MKLHARQMDMLSDLELPQLHRIDLLNQSYKANYDQQRKEIDQFINNQITFLDNSNGQDHLSLSSPTSIKKIQDYAYIKSELNDQLLDQKNKSEFQKLINTQK